MLVRFGHKRTFRLVSAMSALPPKPDILRRNWNELCAKSSADQVSIVSFGGEEIRFVLTRA
jgi:hypothetical protein